jgi:6-phosphogluconolactonase
MSCAPRWHAVPDATGLELAAMERIVAGAAAAIHQRGQFLCVLAGGNTPRGLYQRLRHAPLEWAAWRIYFGDERCLPTTDPARNSRMAGAVWLDHVSIPAARVHVIPAELGAIEGARSYAETLQGVGEFDLVLLGLGEDGHTASLFRGHDWGTAPESSDALAILDAPKPPPQRVSLSAARLSRARQVLFLVGGESKRQAIADWRAGKNIPAAAIMPAQGADVLVEKELLAP